MNFRIDRFIQALLAKSQHCQHGCSCFEHVSIQGLQTFKYAYVLRTALSLLQILVKFKKNKLKQIPKILISKDNIKFCLFLSSYTLITKGLHCLLRNKYEQDSPNYAFYCGLLGGMISLSFLKYDQRKFWALYMIVRALDTRFHNLQNTPMSSYILSCN
ncbi:unnamed protein product (macronuclear) [Paramecium tetraurelia]|uniref:Transmembrane protein 135 N-terminal domain-containing protein n=1 Tax=Paramecium tetraurelia TaxID=5888 RepID=A0CQL1_PARTE|nr:uncharacterized protein GSPATT00009426001 [Paramecium tetraurelia]CAK73078.1 unnamed protein product [Paramecium tetraurelia]|eukprot:XP_001440475.1 hypothetical protein (macronuclear) [Paramecium tetraurelia strain d4-2]